MGRAPCCDKTQVKRGPWSPEEDSTLKNYMHKFGTGGNWIALPHKAGLKRCGKSCRLRWLNYLRPDIKHGGFTEEEDHIILTLYNSIGSRWSVIASRLPGRTDNDVKNYWNTKLKKKLLAAANTSQAINFSSTAPISQFVPQLEHNYQYYGSNSDISNISYYDQQNLVLPQELLFSYPAQASSLPSLMEVPDQVGRSEASSTSTFGDEYQVWSGDGGVGDDGFLTDLIGSGFSLDNFLNGIDFQEKTSGVYPNLASSLI